MLKIFDVLMIKNISLAYYDIIDITPGTNGDFIRSMPNDAMHEIMLFGSTEQQSVTENVKELIVKFIKVYYSLFHYNVIKTVGCSQL